MLNPDVFCTFVSVKQTVTDIENILEALLAEMRVLRGTITAQREEICALRCQMEKLTEENQDLRDRLSKTNKPGKNSSNSSTPPSKENMRAEAERRTKTLRRPSGKKPGGQPGHKGGTLRLTDSPDCVEEDAPSFCTNCGHDLSDCEKRLDHITQIISLPDLKPVIKEVRHYVTVCKNCGKLVKADWQRGRGKNAVIYDASVKALVVYLSVVEFLPYGRIERLMREAFKLRISQGSIDNWIREAKRKAAPAIEKIKEYIMKSAVVGFDETGCYCNKRLDWTWIAQTTLFTLLFRGSSRGHKELEERFGNALKRMVAVTDRHSAYFVLNFFDHQVCLAHLLRNLQYLSELDKVQGWSGNVETLLRDAIRQRNERPGEVIDKQPFLKRLDKLLSRSLEKLGKEFEKLRKGLQKCRNYLFTFLERPEIPSDNNASERGIRKVKIKLKNSCTFRSTIGADVFHELFSIVDTARKHNQNSYSVIRAMF